MPVVLRKNISGAELVLWAIDESEDDILGMVSEDDRASVAGFSSSVRRRERLAWRAALRSCGEHAKVGYAENGAPYLTGMRNRFISVSHCRGMACLLMAEKRCAVDIEPDDRNCRKVEEKFMSEEELSLMENHPNPWCAVWCMKEALYKYSGRSELDLKRDLVIENILTDGCFVARMADQKVKVNVMYEAGYVVAFIV